MNILRKHAAFFNISQRVLDIVILLLITWLFGKKFGPTDLIKIFAIYGSLLLFAVFSLLNIYKSWRGVSISNQIKRLLVGWIIALVVFNIIILLVSNKEQFAVLWPFALFRSPEFLYWSVFVFAGLVVERLIVKLVLRSIRDRGYNQRSAVIVGAGKTGVKLAQYLRENKWMGINLNGFFDDKLAEGDTVSASESVLGQVIGSIEKCSEFSLKNNIDMVFIALPMRDEEKINKLIWELGTKGINVYMVPDLFTLGIQKAKLDHWGELYIMDLNLFPGWKRVFDIIFSLFIIMVTLPVWLIIMVIIKKEDGGPIFYKHLRIMESGKKFYCLKFRTMHVNADQRLQELLERNPDLQTEWDNSYKLKNDPRITKAGRLLRKTSLDELPQFLNVLAGDMSVVGARPIVTDELEKYYSESALTYCAMKPGVTGLWQTGQRSDTIDYNNRVELDCWYVLHCSVWLDIKIILTTIWRIFRPKGAY